ncbi:hypothetical protein DL771_002322 [Monosporascus sp. 5C6A]|nr:hypothetical protein DL771_002322 [Monosporascus sp. 5C6A]
MGGTFTVEAAAAFPPIHSVEGNPSAKRTVAAESSSRRTPARAAVNRLPAAPDVRRAPMPDVQEDGNFYCGPVDRDHHEHEHAYVDWHRSPRSASATATEPTAETFTTTTTATAYFIYFLAAIPDFGPLSAPDGLGCCEVCQGTPGCGVFAWYDGNCLLPVPHACAPADAVGCYGTPGNNAVAGYTVGNGSFGRLWWDQAP